MGPKKVVGNILGWKKFWVEKIWGGKIFGLKKNLGTEKICGPQKIWGPQKIVCLKEFGAQKMLCTTKIRIRKNDG